MHADKIVAAQLFQKIIGQMAALRRHLGFVAFCCLDVR